MFKWLFGWLKRRSDKSDISHFVRMEFRNEPREVQDHMIRTYNGDNRSWA